MMWDDMVMKLARLLMIHILKCVKCPDGRYNKDPTGVTGGNLSSRVFGCNTRQCAVPTGYRKCKGWLCSRVWQGNIVIKKGKHGKRG